MLSSLEVPLGAADMPKGDVVLLPLDMARESRKDHLPGVSTLSGFFGTPGLLQAERLVSN